MEKIIHNGFCYEKDGHELKLLSFSPSDSKVDTLVIEDYVELNPVCYVSESFKLPKGVKTVVIGNQILSLPKKLFKGNRQLETLTFGKKLGIHTFIYNLPALTNVIVHHENKYYESQGGSLYEKDTNILIWTSTGAIRPGTEAIGNKAFVNMSLDSVILTKMKGIASYAFDSCKIGKLYADGNLRNVLPHGITGCEIDELIFGDDGADFENGLTFATNAIISCKISKLTISRKHVYFYDKAVALNEIESIEMPFVEITKKSFLKSFDSLKSIILPKKRIEHEELIKMTAFMKAAENSTGVINLVKIDEDWMENKYW